MVNSKPDCEALETKFALGPSVLLHESNDDSTLVVLVVVIHLSKGDAVLRVVPERLCNVTFLLC